MSAAGALFAVCLVVFVIGAVYTWVAAVSNAPTTDTPPYYFYAAIVALFGMACVGVWWLYLGIAWLQSMLVP